MMQKQLLKSIVRNPNLHARFLNTLSLIELEGAQRLSRVVKAERCSTFILEHAAEEYRHAFYLRKLASKIRQAPIDAYSAENTLCLTKSTLYIKHLDQRICLLLKAHGLSTTDLIKKRAFILTTFAIETRALPFYRAYQEVLDEENVSISVKSILSEEENHLAHINALFLSDPGLKLILDKSLAIEENLFESWLLHVKNSLGCDNNH